jgi:hypothetical protein
MYISIYVSSREPTPRSSTMLLLTQKTCVQVCLYVFLGICSCESTPPCSATFLMHITYIYTHTHAASASGQSSYTHFINTLMLVFIYTYTPTHTHIYIYIYTHTQIHTHTHTHTQSHHGCFICRGLKLLHVCRPHTYMHTCTARVYIYIYIYIYTHTHTCIHTQIHECARTLDVLFAEA